MKWLKDFLHEFVDFVKWQLTHDSFMEELEDEYEESERLCELSEKYERLQRHYPNILARLNAAVERKEQK